MIQIFLACVTIDLYFRVIFICFCIDPSWLADRHLGHFGSLGGIFGLGNFSYVQDERMLRELEVKLRMVAFSLPGWTAATNKAAQANIEPSFIFRPAKAPCALVFIDEPALQIISVVILVPARTQALRDNFH